MLRRFQRRINSMIYDPDYQAILDYSTSNAITKPSVPQRLIQNQLVIDLKAAGIWNKLDIFYLFVNDSGVDFSLINWIDPGNYNLDNGIGLIHTVNSNIDQNFASTIGTGYIPSINGTNYTLNDCSFGYKVFTASTITVGDSVMQTVGGNKMHLDDSSFNCDCYINSSTALKFGNAYRSISRTNGGLITVSKKNTTTNKLFLNGVLQSNISQSPIALPTSEIVCYTGSHDTKLQLQFVGGGFTNVEAASFSTIIDQYLIDVIA